MSRTPILKSQFLIQLIDKGSGLLNFVNFKKLSTTLKVTSADVDVHKRN